jgi:molecular chaperone HtpG
LKSLFTENREEEKWNDIKIVLEYGMLSEDKFYENQSFVLYPVDDKFYTLEELKENLKESKLIKTEN